MNNSINLRKEFDYLVNEFGINAFIIRKLKHTRCKCYNYLNRDGNSKCKICGGSGNLNSIEKIKILVQDVSKNASYMNMSDFGLTISNTYVIYCKFDTVPKVGDQIFITGFGKDNLPIDIKYDCLIVSLKETRGDGGKIEFYHLLTEFKAEKMRIDQSRLNAIPTKVKKKLMEGDRFIWPKN